jgi:hypothetical protein
MLKTFARLLLVLVTVGGGCTGVLSASDVLTHTKLPDWRFVAMVWTTLALYSLITAAGLMFVNSPRRTLTMLAAIAVQIPWFDLPGIEYHLPSVLYLAMTFGPPHGANRIGTYIEWSAQISNRFDFRIGGSPGGDWSLGVNLFAVFVLILWLFYTRTNQRDGL